MSRRQGSAAPAPRRRNGPRRAAGPRACDGRWRLSRAGRLDAPPRPWRGAAAPSAPAGGSSLRRCRSAPRSARHRAATRCAAAASAGATIATPLAGWAGISRRPSHGLRVERLRRAVLCQLGRERASARLATMNTRAPRLRHEQRGVDHQGAYVVARRNQLRADRCKVDALVRGQQRFDVLDGDEARRAPALDQAPHQAPPRPEGAAARTAQSRAVASERMS